MRHERRKDKRTPVELHLEISHMFRQNDEIITNMGAEITVVDISRSGIGFISQAKLPVSYYFNAKLILNQKEFVHTVVKILRQTKKTEECYMYGAQFVGLTPFLADKITEAVHTSNETVEMTNSSNQNIIVD